MVFLWLLTFTVICGLIVPLEWFDLQWTGSLLIAVISFIGGVGCALIDRLQSRWIPELRALRAFFRNTFRHLYAAEGRTMSPLQAEHIATGAGLMSPAENGVKLTSVGRKAMKGPGRNNLKAIQS